MNYDEIKALFMQPNPFLSPEIKWDDVDPKLGPITFTRYLPEEEMTDNVIAMAPSDWGKWSVSWREIWTRDNWGLGDDRPADLPDWIYRGEGQKVGGANIWIHPTYGTVEVKARGYGEIPEVIATPAHEAAPVDLYLDALQTWKGQKKQATPDGEYRVTSPTGAQKGQKLARFDLIPADALYQLAEMYGAGAQKYADRNWEAGYDWSLSFAAMQRHAWQFWGGEDIDPETGQPHMTAVIFHAMAQLTFMTTHREFDNRPLSLKSQEEGE